MPHSGKAKNPKSMGSGQVGYNLSKPIEINRPKWIVSINIKGLLWVWLAPITTLQIYFKSDLIAENSLPGD